MLYDKVDDDRWWVYTDMAGVCGYMGGGECCPGRRVSGVVGGDELNGY